MKNGLIDITHLFIYIFIYSYTKKWAYSLMNNFGSSKSSFDWLRNLMQPDLSCQFQSDFPSVKEAAM